MSVSVRRETRMRTVVIGVGNPVLGDDAVGLHVAALLSREHPGAADYREASVGGLGLLDLLVGYDRAVIVDCFEGRRPGEVHVMDEKEAFGSATACCVHDCSFATALALGRRVGAAMPERVTVVAVEVADAREFREGLSPEAAAAVERAAEAVLALLGRR